MIDHDDNALRGRVFTVLPHDPTQHWTTEEWNRIMKIADLFLEENPDEVAM